MRDMKLVVITGLLFLLLVTLGGVYYLYQQNLTMQKKAHQAVSVVVAKRNIPQNKRIEREDLKVMQFQKSMIPFKVLMPNEIIGKYATVKIFLDEPIRSEKISKIITREQNASTAKKVKHDLYNIASKLFQNPNYMLKSGDLIDIVGVWKEAEKLVVKYIAVNTEIYGFLFRGVLEEKALKSIEKKVKEKKSKKSVKTTIYQYADEVLLDTQADTVTAIIDAHNRGHQLWMVLSGDRNKTKTIESIKSRYMLEKKPQLKQKSVHKSAGKHRYTRHYPKATITYGANEVTTVTTWR